MTASTPACRVGARSITLPGELTPPEGFVSPVQLGHHHGLPVYLYPAGTGDTYFMVPLLFCNRCILEHRKMLALKPIKRFTGVIKLIHSCSRSDLNIH